MLIVKYIKKFLNEWRHRKESDGFGSTELESGKMGRRFQTLSEDETPYYWLKNIPRIHKHKKSL